MNDQLLLKRSYYSQLFFFLLYVTIVACSNPQKTPHFYEDKKNDKFSFIWFVIIYLKEDFILVSHYIVIRIPFLFLSLLKYL